MGARFGISKGIRNAENNHRDDGIEEPLGTVEHLTQYGGMSGAKSNHMNTTL